MFLLHLAFFFLPSVFAFLGWCIFLSRLTPHPAPRDIPLLVLPTTFLFSVPLSTSPPPLLPRPRITFFLLHGLNSTRLYFSSQLAALTLFSSHKARFFFFLTSFRSQCAFPWTVGLSLLLEPLDPPSFLLRFVGKGDLDFLLRWSPPV